MKKKRTFLPNKPKSARKMAEILTIEQAEEKLIEKFGIDYLTFTK